MRAVLATALLALVLVLSPPAARGQSYATYGADRDFPIEAGPETRRGGAVVAGYIRNEAGLAVREMRLRVEQLDPAGQTLIGYVFGDLTPGSRSYFEVRVPSASATYRVSVLSFTWINAMGM